MQTKAARFNGRNRTEDAPTSTATSSTTSFRSSTSAQVGSLVNFTQTQLQSPSQAALSSSPSTLSPSAPSTPLASSISTPTAPSFILSITSSSMISYFTSSQTVIAISMSASTLGAAAAARTSHSAPHQNLSSARRILIIASVIPGSIVFILLLVILALCCRKRKSKSFSSILYETDTSQAALNDTSIPSWVPGANTSKEKGFRDTASKFTILNSTLPIPLADTGGQANRNTEQSSSILNIGDERSFVRRRLFGHTRAATQGSVRTVASQWSQSSYRHSTEVIPSSTPMAGTMPVPEVPPLPANLVGVARKDEPVGRPVMRDVPVRRPTLQGEDRRFAGRYPSVMHRGEDDEPHDAPHDGSLFARERVPLAAALSPKLYAPEHDPTGFASYAERYPPRVRLQPLPQSPGRVSPSVWSCRRLFRSSESTDEAPPAYDDL
jgi:hypothetical protein